MTRQWRHDNQHNVIQHNDIKTTFSKTAFSTMGLFLTLSIKDTQHNDTWHKYKVFNMLCRYAECRIFLLLC